MKIFLCILVLASCIWAAPIGVTLQNATATFSQTSYSVQSSIDGVYSSIGWAVSPNLVSQTAAFETNTNITASKITFAMHQLYGNDHTIGRLRWSYTTADRSTFADGLTSNGDVTTTWTVFSDLAAITLPSGTTYSVLADNSILMGGVAGSGVYYISFNLSGIANITGFRLEAMEDPSLPNGGPGRCTSNGNFVLSELVVTAELTTVPEPSSICIGLVGIFVFGLKKYIV